MAAGKEVLGRGTTVVVEQRGIWVPDGMTAGEIMTGASVLKNRYGVDVSTAEAMVRAVLAAIRVER